MKNAAIWIVVLACVGVIEAFVLRPDLRPHIAHRHEDKPAKEAGASEPADEHKEGHEGKEDEKKEEKKEGKEEKEESHVSRLPNGDVVVTFDA